jgi:addiction module RelE/StbE family toxin
VKLVWSTWALPDRDGIFSHIEADNPSAAVSVDERLAGAARRLRDFPESGRPGRIDGTRELVISGTPYVAAYVVTEMTVRIPARPAWRAAMAGDIA